MSPGTGNVGTSPSPCPSGSRLPLPQNEQENEDFVTVAKSFIETGYIALDANDQETEGTWLTYGNKPVTYINFLPPADNFDNAEHFAVFCPYCVAPHGPGNWGDVRSTFIVTFVCEKDAV